MSAEKVLYLVDQHGWLESYDPDGGDPNIAYPTGTFGVTTDPARAMVFPNHAAAMACWMQTSTRTPLRPDGKPNRPLSAMTVTLHSPGERPLLP